MGIEKNILEQCKRYRMPVPDKIKDAPVLYAGLEFIHQGFMDLTTCRELGMGEGPIRWIDIVKYCEVHAIEGEQAEDFIYFISVMDAAYLKYRAEKTKAGK